MLVLEIATQKRWLIQYAAINVDGADVEIREQPRPGLGRNEVAVGEMVGFVGRDQQERSGKVIRLNDETVTLLCGRVPGGWPISSCIGWSTRRRSTVKCSKSASWIATATIGRRLPVTDAALGR